MRTLIGLCALWGLIAAAPVSAAPIDVVDPSVLTGKGLVTFDDFPGGASPGMPYDTILMSGNVVFGERLSGQTLTTNGKFDALNGAPWSSTPIAGLPGQNLDIFDFWSNVLAGLGAVGFPDFDAVGEGAVAAAFGSDQSEFGFDLLGGDGGSADVSFYRRDGSLIATVTLNGLADQSYAFKRDQGVADIAGITIMNTDRSGIAFDNLRYDVTTASPLPVPEPATLAVMLAGLAGLLQARRRR